MVTPSDYLYLYIFLYWVLGPSPCQHFLDSLNLLHFYISVYNRFTSFNGSDSNFKPFPRNRNHVRKNFFAEHFAYAQLLGVGGPGAPHVFYLQRLEDSGTSIYLYQCFLPLSVFPQQVFWATFLRVDLVSRIRHSDQVFNGKHVMIRSGNGLDTHPVVLM